MKATHQVTFHDQDGQHTVRGTFIASCALFNLLKNKPNVEVAMRQIDAPKRQSFKSRNK